MSASDHVSKAQTGKYEYHMEGGDYTHSARAINVYKGEKMAGTMTVTPDSDRTAEVYFMGVDPRHRHIVPTMIGLAQREMSASGMTLQPSTDLSADSSRLVRKLQGRGLVTGSAESEASNDIEFRHYNATILPHQREGRRLNTSTVALGRSHIRQQLKESRRGRE